MSLFIRYHQDGLIVIHGINLLPYAYHLYEKDWKIIRKSIELCKELLILSLAQYFSFFFIMGAA